MSSHQQICAQPVVSPPATTLAPPSASVGPVAGSAAGPRLLMAFSLMTALLGILAIVVATHVMNSRGGEFAVRLGALTHNTRDQALVFALDNGPILIIAGIVGATAGAFWHLGALRNATR